MDRADRSFKLIETMRFGPFPAGFDTPEGASGPYGWPLSGYFLLDLHMERLLRSAAELGFRASEGKILKALSEAASSISAMDEEAAGAGGGTGEKRGPRHPFRVRLLLSEAGEVELSWMSLGETVQPVYFDISPAKRPSEGRFIFHKTTRRSFLDEQHALAQKRGLFDTLFLNDSGMVTEGTITNLFIERAQGEAMITPPLSAGLLPGVLRQHLLDQGRAIEAEVGPDELAAARTIYLGNSVRGLLRAKMASSGLSPA